MNIPIRPIQLLLFSLMAFGIGANGQPVPGLPTIEPVNVQLLVDEDFPGGYCVRQIIKDGQGRMWFGTCGAMTQPFMLKLLQYDGYTTTAIDFLNSKIGPQNRLHFYEGPSPNGLPGFVNVEEDTSFLFSLQHDYGETFFIPVSDGEIVGLIAGEHNRFWVFVREGNQLKWLDWDGGTQLTIIEVFDLPPDIGAPKLFGHAPDHAFARLGDDLFGSLPCLPPFRISIGQKKLHLLEIGGLLTTLPISSFLCPVLRKGVAAMIYEQAGQIFYLPNVESPHFFQFEKDREMFMPMGIIPDAFVGAAIFQDQVGHLLFLSVHEKEPKEYHALLRDTSGNFWNYTPMLAKLGDINSVYGSDFSKTLYAATSSGAYSVTTAQDALITTLLPGKSIRWIGEIESGKYLIRQQSSDYYLFDEEKKTVQVQEELPCDSSFFDIKKTGKLISDKKGQLWIIRKNQLTSFKADDKGQCKQLSVGFHIHTAEFLADGRLAVIKGGVSKQLFWYDPGKDKAPVPAKGNGMPIVFNIPVNQLLATADGYLWVASMGGLYKIHPDAQTIRHYGMTKDFDDFRIITMHEDARHRLWLGTVKAGIQIFDPEKEQVLAIVNKENGLANNTVVSILEDEEGDIWAGTYNGLSILSPEGKVMTNLSEEDGLSSNEFNRFAQLKSTSGKLFLGTLNGLAIFDPIPFKKHYSGSSSVKIYLTKLSFFDSEQGQELSLSSFDSKSSPLILEAGRRYLKVKVALSNYGASTKSRFVYKLDGLEQEWNYLGHQHQISLTNLPAGRYTLLINGIDERGLWAAQPLAIRIHARQFFYKTAWFYILIAMAVAFLVWLWIRRLFYERRMLAEEVRKRTIEIEHDKALIEKQAKVLQELDEVKSRFFVNISHELRTPLTLIATPINHVIGKYGKNMNREIKKTLEMVFQNSRNLLNLVDELLELSRIDAKAQSFETKPIHLHSFTKQLFEAYASVAQLNKIDYRFSFQLSHELTVAIDADKVAKILNNLLSNALKFTAAGGTIEFVIKNEKEEEHGKAGKPSHLFFSVRDTGRGILPDDLPKVFDRYFQTRDKHLPAESGTGVGLSLAKELAELMGGTLKVESEWGKESTFYLLLPVEQLEASVQQQENDIVEKTKIAAPAHPDAFLLDTNKPKVLIVEDNPDMQQLISTILSDDYRYLICSNGLEAWELLERRGSDVADIQLILSDVMMPQMDGYKLLEKIKTHPFWQKYPIILLTARAHESDKLHALRLGVDDYLIKPFLPEELLVRVGNLTQNFRQRIAAATNDLKGDQWVPDFEQLSSHDYQWLKELEKAAVQALDQQVDLNTLYLSGKMNLSDRQMLRRIKSLTGLSIKRYILAVKLQKARYLLENRAFNTISEVAFASGFNTPTYFSKVYSNYFGKPPAEYFADLRK